jgi:hypothetical protein
MSITREELVGGITPASFRFQREKRGNGGGDDADRWGPPDSEGREELGTGSGSAGSGPWARSGAGPKRFPGAFSIFIFLSFFSFSVFFNLSNTFQNCSKSIQTNFAKFLKIKTTIQNSNKQVFIIRTTFHKINVKWPRFLFA